MLLVAEKWRGLKWKWLEICQAVNDGPPL